MPIRGAVSGFKATTPLRATARRQRWQWRSSRWRTYQNLFQKGGLQFQPLAEIPKTPHPQGSGLLAENPKATPKGRGRPMAKVQKLVENPKVNTTKAATQQATHPTHPPKRSGDVARPDGWKTTAETPLRVMSRMSRQRLGDLLSSRSWRSCLRRIHFRVLRQRLELCHGS